MKCPCCKSELVITHQDRYESMGDGTYLRDGYQCLKESCVFNNFNVVWLSDGTIYTSPQNGMSYYMQKTILEKFVENKNLHPIGNYMIEIIPDFKHPKNENEPYKKRIFKIFKFWKRTDNDCFAYIVPLHRMVRFSIRQFNIHKKYALNGDANRIKDCFYEMKALDITGKPDGRLYTKIAATLINIFWRKDCNKIFDKYIEIYGDDKY